MATVKHISSRNADYGQILDYLMFRFDERISKPILGPEGEMLLREDYIVEGQLTEPSLFGIECMETNRRFGKNRTREEVKTHHYILSFDPRDVPDHGLTMEKAQTIGRELTAKYFPGHQALICTHPDGNNKSGNIHVHIVINSVRKEEAEKQDFMERESDRLAGYKHRATKNFVNAFKKGVMEICEREGLYQVDLLNPAKEKITEKEYRAKLRGEKADPGFKTELGSLRSTIKKAMAESENETMFRKVLMEKYGIVLTESRGRWGYKTNGNRTVRGRRLGANYEKEYVLAMLGTIGRITDISSIEKAGTNVGYRRAIVISNLKKSADTLLFMREHGLETEEDVRRALKIATEAMMEAQARVKELDAEMKAIRSLRKAVKQMKQYRDVYQTYRRSGRSEKFKEEHYVEVAVYEKSEAEAKKLAGELGFDKVPTGQMLKGRQKEAGEGRSEAYGQYLKLKAERDKMAVIKSNLDKFSWRGVDRTDSYEERL